MKKFWLIDYKYIGSIKENTGYLITPDVIDALKRKHEGEKNLYVCYDSDLSCKWTSLNVNRNGVMNTKRYLEKLDYIYSGEITRKYKLVKINFI